MLRVAVLPSSVAVALSFAAVGTAAAGSRVDVTVTMYDKKHVIFLLSERACTGPGSCYPTDWIDVTRGEVARFTVFNKGTKPHNFKIFGKVRTTAIKPGGKAIFIVQLEKRGLFPYMSTLNEHKGLKGIFTVN